MHTHTVDDFRHEHVFLGPRHDRHERRTWLVVALTAAMMVGEIAGGTIFGSMALVADGWHMLTHAGALTVAALAYRFVRRHARDERFAFGTGKLGELAAFSSAMILAMIALLIGYESAVRLIEPVAIRFDQAIAIAIVGLIVNLVSAWLLWERDGHSHGNAHAQGHHDHSRHDRSHYKHGHHHDQNLRGAYLHVIADALTSVLAIIGLLTGRLYGWVWMDPLMGIVGALVIAHWSVGLLRGAGAVLLDAVPDREIAAQVRRRLEVDGDRLADLHLWRLGPGHMGLVTSIVSDAPQAPEAYKARLDGIEGLSHITVEVHACGHAPRDAALSSRS